MDKCLDLYDDRVFGCFVLLGRYCKLEGGGAQNIMWDDTKISSCSFLDFLKQWISYEESISDLFFSVLKPF